MTDFRTVYGYDPRGVWAAPGRLNIIGEFTDYNDGFVLPIALESVTRAAAACRDDNVVRVASTQVPPGEPAIIDAPLETLSPRGGGYWGDYAFGVVWAIAEAGYPLSGVDIFIDSDVPIGAGLSSSAALECAIGLALRDLLAPALTRRELARLARCAENDFVGVPSGSMDQTASLFCIAGHALLLDTRTGRMDQLPFDLDEAGLVLIVIDTGMRRRLAASGYGDRRRACEAAAVSLGVPALRDASLADLGRIGDTEVRQRARHVISENNRVLEVVEHLKAGNLAAIGPILSEGNRSLRDDFGVSSPELDLVVESAVGAGALGARMVGGGFGGCVIVLARVTDQAAIAQSVTRAFTEAGKPPLHNFRAIASDGARRLV